MDLASKAASESESGPVDDPVKEEFMNIDEFRDSCCRTLLLDLIDGPDSQADGLKESRFFFAESLDR